MGTQPADTEVQSTSESLYSDIPGQEGERLVNFAGKLRADLKLQKYPERIADIIADGFQYLKMSRMSDYPELQSIPTSDRILNEVAKSGLVGDEARELRKQLAINSYMYLQKIIRAVNLKDEQEGKITSQEANEQDGEAVLMNFFNRYKNVIKYMIDYRKANKILEEDQPKVEGDMSSGIDFSYTTDNLEFISKFLGNADLVEYETSKSFKPGPKNEIQLPAILNADDRVAENKRVATAEGIMGLLNSRTPAA